MEHDKTPEQQPEARNPESILTSLEKKAYMFERIHEESKRTKEARAEAEKDVLEEREAFNAALNEKYVGKTGGKKVKVTGWAEVIIRPQEDGDWEYQQTDLDGEELTTTRVDTRNFDPELRTAGTYMNLSSILRATDNKGNSYNIPLSDETSVKFIPEE